MAMKNINIKEKLCRTFTGTLSINLALAHSKTVFSGLKISCLDGIDRLLISFFCGWISCFVFLLLASVAFGPRTLGTIINGVCSKEMFTIDNLVYYHLGIIYACCRHLIWFPLPVLIVKYHFLASHIVLDI